MFLKHLSNLYHGSERQMHKEFMCKCCIYPPVSSAFLAFSAIQFSKMDPPVHLIEVFFFLLCLVKSVFLCAFCI